MKKRNLKTLDLNKKSISKLQSNTNAIKGGSWVTLCDCPVSVGPLLCGATSVFVRCAAACPTVPE
ncbi:hypothetical protein [uncultured Kordia sp.]|uniref:hypothetical protein n=1 Tax=uncultured Kordia sp. TaxID=507699 RepID=UPI002627EE64|nr:hypothetical protein [uncultured Kordia sp.]